MSLEKSGGLLLHVNIWDVFVLSASSFLRYIWLCHVFCSERACPCSLVYALLVCMCSHPLACVFWQELPCVGGVLDEETRPRSGVWWLAGGGSDPPGEEWRSVPQVAFNLVLSCIWISILLKEHYVFLGKNFFFLRLNKLNKQTLNFHDWINWKWKLTDQTHHSLQGYSAVALVPWLPSSNTASAPLTTLHSSMPLLMLTLSGWSCAMDRWWGGRWTVSRLDSSSTPRASAQTNHRTWHGLIKARKVRQGALSSGLSIKRNLLN